MNDDELPLQARIELTGHLLSRIADLAGAQCGDCRVIKELALRAYHVLGRPKYDLEYLASSSYKRDDETIQRLFDEIRIESNTRASMHEE